jgi:hypothetical protein
MSTGNYPNISQLPDTVFEESSDTAFDFGLERILDGIEAFIKTRQT